MSTSLSGLSTNFFPSPQNGFTTTLASTISSGATTVPLNSVAGYTNGQIAAFVVDPTDSTKKQTFTGVIDTSGVQVTSVVWTAGTNQSHSGGSTVVDYVTATHLGMVSKGITQQHTQAGAHTAVTATSVTTTAAVTAGSGFTVLAGSVTLPSASISQAALPLGACVQAVSTNFSAVATGTTTIPFDDTIPQNTEGDQYITQAITPKATTNLLVIEGTAFVSNSAAVTLIGALFQDSTASALAVSADYQTTATGPVCLKITHQMTAGTTSSTTFKVRIGGDTAGTTTFNGTGAARKFGGITLSNITIREFKA